MIVLGLTGPAGCGKNTVADYLSERYGFVQLAFADRIRDEVQAAYRLEDQSLLRDRATKEEPTEKLCLNLCVDGGFVTVANKILREQDALTWQYDIFERPLSPRQILQWWGTDYRRKRDEDYWIVKTAEHLASLRAMYAYPEQRPQYFVATDCRFENERDWIWNGGVHDGSIWHITRPGIAKVNPHASETPLPVLDGERELFNGDTIDRLYGGIDLLLRTSAKFVRVEPMLPMADPTEDALAEYGAVTE